MFSPASSSNVSSCVRSVRKSSVDGHCPFSSFALPLSFVAHSASGSASWSAVASSLGRTRSAKRTAASLLTISRTRACACTWPSSAAGLEDRWRRAAASPRRMPSSRPRGAPVSAKPASKPSCSAASLPADMPSRYPAYPQQMVHHHRRGLLSLLFMGFLAYGCEVCGEAGPLCLGVV
jgi:hypothetical protein